MAAPFIKKMKVVSINYCRYIAKIFHSRLTEIERNVFLPALSLVDVPQPHISEKSEIGSSLSWDGLLWAVPKRRRSIQVNRTRRRSENRLYKTIDSMIPCDECGFPKKPNLLCNFCFEKVRKETKVIQDAMVRMYEEKNILPDKETAIVYQNESSTEEDKEKYMVEIPKERPPWFFKDFYVSRKQLKKT